MALNEQLCDLMDRAAAWACWFLIGDILITILISAFLVLLVLLAAMSSTIVRWIFTLDLPEASLKNRGDKDVQ